MCYIPLGEAENPFFKEELLEKFERINPSFELTELSAINSINNN